jgi:hypothetical protein
LGPFQLAAVSSFAVEGTGLIYAGKTARDALNLAPTGRTGGTGPHRLRPRSRHYRKRTLPRRSSRDVLTGNLRGWSLAGISVVVNNPASGFVIMPAAVIPVK